MTYLIESAIIYDMIFFSTINLNGNVAVDFIKKESGIEQDEILENYNEFLNLNTLTPPKSTYLFFFFDGSRPCPLSSQFFNGYYSQYKDYRNRISNVPIFKKFILGYYFNELVGAENTELIMHGDGETITNSILLLIKKLHINENYYDIFSALCYNFGKVVKELLDYLDLLYDRMAQYHNHRITQSKRIIKNFFQDNKKQNLLQKYLILDSDFEFKTQLYSVCYMQPYVIISSKNDRQYTFIIGCNMLEQLDNRLHYNYIRATRSIQILGRVHVDEIINCLRQGPKTISQIARSLILARTSIGRIVYELSDELVLTSYKKGSEIYYQLNYAYFEQVRNKLIRYIDEIIALGYNEK